MENLKATNEQLKNEAMALRTTLEAEIKNETRAEHIAKLYTIIFDEQLSADPQGSLALSMILNMKTAVGLTTELTIFMNSAGMYRLNSVVITSVLTIPPQKKRNLQFPYPISLSTSRAPTPFPPPPPPKTNISTWAPSSPASSKPHYLS